MISSKYDRQFKGNVDDLKVAFDNHVGNFQNDTTNYNSEASLAWIIRGLISYFDSLDSGFLGDGNKSGIPDFKADQFANNIYRLQNAIKSISTFWHIDIELLKKPKELNFILDIRTLIVHSGDIVTDIKSLDLSDYKNMQLGRIFRKDVGFNNPLRFKGDASDMDYCIQVWADKHDKTKKQNLAISDYHINNGTFLDMDVYIKADDIRNIALCYIQDFVELCDGNIPVEHIVKMPGVKKQFIPDDVLNVNFEKLSEFVKGNDRSIRAGYSVENGIQYWDGFGLYRLYDYVKNRCIIDEQIRDFILYKIRDTLSTYWDNYEDASISKDDMISLNVKSVFDDCIPDFDGKGYVFEKLFYQVAPLYNTSNRDDRTDIWYLNDFLFRTGNVLNHNFNLQQDDDGIVSEFFIECVRHHLYDSEK